MADDDEIEAQAAVHDGEKKAGTHGEPEVGDDGPSPWEERGNDDIKVLVRGSGGGGVKTTPDGETALIPQPSDEPDDPLNWSWRKKHLVFASLILPALLTDFGMTYGAATFEKQAETWHMPVTAVANSISGGIFLQGVGGIFAVPFTQRYGRLPVLFWSQLLALAVVVGATLSPTYAGFTAARTLQGWFNTAPQVIGLTVIHDMFFFHERTRKINVWAISFLIGPFLAPFVSSMILSRLGWREDYGVLASLYALSLIVVVLIGEETLFDRKEPGNNRRSGRGAGGRLLLLSGVTGWRATGRPRPASVLYHILQVQIRPQMLLPTVGFAMMLVMWSIGLVTTVSQFLYPAPYLFTPVQVGLFYLAPCIGAAMGEVWGHWFNDWLCGRYVRTHGGNYRPENRLWGCYPGVVLGVAGLVLYGQGLDRELPWVALAVGFGMYAFAHVSATVAMTAYLLDSFPNHSVVAAGIINMWRTTGGFCTIYFQTEWVARTGAGASFGAQAAMLAASFPTVVAVQVWGRKWRARYPPPESGN